MPSSPNQPDSRVREVQAEADTIITLKPRWLSTGDSTAQLLRLRCINDGKFQFYRYARFVCAIAAASSGAGCVGSPSTTVPIPAALASN